MENRSVNPSPLVISPLEDEEGELFTCSTHKAVKSAMLIIDSKYPHSKYQMHLTSGFGIFGLITLPRKAITTIVNKLMTRTLEFGYVGPLGDSYYNPNGTRVFNVTIKVTAPTYRDLSLVHIDIKTTDSAKEEEE